MGGDIITYKGNAGTDQSDGIIYPEPAFDSGVAQSATGNTIVLRVGAPSVDLTGLQIEIVRGTGAAAGASQSTRLIIAYDTGGKTAIVRPNWAVTPGSDSVYKITYPEKVNQVLMDGINFPVDAMAAFWNAAIKSGTIATGSSSSVIKTNLTGFGTNEFIGSAFMCLGANNYGIIKPIVGYDTATGDITVSPAFSLAPANGDLCYDFGTTG